LFSIDSFFLLILIFLLIVAALYCFSRFLDFVCSPTNGIPYPYLLALLSLFQ
jgi:hypothetical protein